MRYFGTEISGSRMRGGKLSIRQRDYCLSLFEAGCSTREIANALGCSQRCVQKTLQRWKSTNSNSSRPRAGRPHVLTARDVRKVLRLAKRFPKVEYRKLLEEAGMWPRDSTHPTVSKRTIQRALAAKGYRKFRAKRRPIITMPTALLRLYFARS